MVKILGLSAPKWLILLTLSIIGALIIMRTRVDEAVRDGLIMLSVRGPRLAEGAGVVGRSWHWVLETSRPLCRYAGEFVDFIFKPLHPDMWFRDVEGGGADAARRIWGLKNTPGWDVVFAIGMVCGAIGGMLGFYRSVAPRKYEFKSRDYSKEKSLI